MIQSWYNGFFAIALLIVVYLGLMPGLVRADICELNVFTLFGHVLVSLSNRFLKAGISVGVISCHSSLLFITAGDARARWSAGS
jgi:hypothetical protein